MAWKEKYNGVTYEVSVVDGVTIHNPPLPESIQKKKTSNMKEIVRTKQFPGAKTDTTFFAGRGTLEDQFKHDPIYLKEILDGAKADGYTPSPHDVYFASLARKKGDRRAFVSQAEGTGKIKKIVQADGNACDGSIKVEGIRG